MANINENNITNKILKKEEQLRRIITSDYPIDPKHAAAHRRKVFHAECYLDELQEVLSVLDCGLTVKLVPAPTFHKQVAKADFAEMEFDGEFCKVAVVTNYPNDNMWLIYTAPLDIL